MRQSCNLDFVVIPRYPHVYCVLRLKLLQGIAGVVRVKGNAFPFYANGLPASVRDLCGRGRERGRFSPPFVCAVVRIACSSGFASPHQRP